MDDHLRICRCLIAEEENPGPGQGCRMTAIKVLHECSALKITAPRVSKAQKALQVVLPYKIPRVVKFMLFAAVGVASIGFIRRECQYP